MFSRKITLHWTKWKRKHVNEVADHCAQQGPWTQQRFCVTDCWGLRTREGKIVCTRAGEEKPGDDAIEGLLEGSCPLPFDADDVRDGHWECVPGGWDHDHCSICWWTLQEAEDPEVGTGWHCEDSENWVCNECYETLLRPRLDRTRP
ncbi:MAG: hypothetical protein ACYS8X_06390 [Planctomycetota bacterium]|jgi:hypothetical protein